MDELSNEEILRIFNHLYRITALSIKMSDHLTSLLDNIATTKEFCEGVAGEILVLQASCKIPEPEASQLASVQELYVKFIANLEQIQQWIEKGGVADRNWDE